MYVLVREYGFCRAALVPCLVDVRLGNHVRLILADEWKIARISIRSFCHLNACNQFIRSYIQYFILPYICMSEHPSVWYLIHT